ncbi:MAG: serine/threonine protein kinase [Gemmatimonadetes bacterium]|nr:serine/threonine protein kinase [Gemmatimonadota bacterium]
MSVDSLRDALAGRYAIDRELGRGGMGVVYLARDIALDRLVALKVLPSELARNPETRERFLREARTAAQLSHPNIVPVYHADAVGDLAFFAMGYVDGENLGERVRARGALPVAEAVRYLREAAWALAYAHARGVVHRDIKPENLLLDRATGRVMVTDFGIARDAARADGLTQTGHVLGTVHYMSPEQVAGEPLDGRSDLYALGVVGFQP